MRELSLHILDVVENSIRAGASRVRLWIGIVRQESRDFIRVTVDDNGRGFAVDTSRALGPFFTTKTGRRAGLGLALFEANAKRAEGGVWLGTSPFLGGARVVSDLRADHVDCPPMGDLAATMLGMVGAHPEVRWTVIIQGHDARPRVWDSDATDAVHTKENLFSTDLARARDVHQFVRTRMNSLIKEN